MLGTYYSLRSWDAHAIYLLSAAAARRPPPSAPLHPSSSHLAVTLALAILLLREIQQTPETAPSFSGYLDGGAHSVLKAPRAPWLSSND